MGTESKILNFLKFKGHSIIIVKDEKINEEFILENKIDFLISFGYRHKISKSVLDLLNEKSNFCNAINLHISYLPWNKGADPNFWSFVENTPKGVTIHCIDENIDTGMIILQKQIDFSLGETLRTSYSKLKIEIENLFIENWHKIQIGKIKPKEQPKYADAVNHKSIEKNHLINKIGENWLDIKIIELLQKLNS